MIYTSIITEYGKKHHRVITSKKFVDKQDALYEIIKYLNENKSIIDGFVERYICEPLNIDSRDFDNKDNPLMVIMTTNGITQERTFGVKPTCPVELKEKLWMVHYFRELCKPSMLLENTTINGFIKLSLRLHEFIEFIHKSTFDEDSDCPVWKYEIKEERMSGSSFA